VVDLKVTNYGAHLAAQNPRLARWRQTAYGPRVAGRIFALAGAALATLSFGSLLAAEESWKLVTEKNGITLEKRAVPDSSFMEYRARAHATASAPAVVSRIWNAISGVQAPPITQRKVLKHGEDEIVVYDQIHAPVVKDRDVTIRIRKVADPRTGAVEISFESRPELGPPPAQGYVRLPVVRGDWRVEPASDGGANVSYRCYSEPGGAIPAFLVRGTQQGNVYDEFERMFQRIGR
jgi:hypothetical protein